MKPRQATSSRKRRLLKTMLGVAVLNLFAAKTASSRTGKPQAEETGNRAMEEDAREVERLYSTKPIRVVLGTREYLIPVNHFTEKGADRPDVFVAQDYFGFVLFLPDFGGFTKGNWQKGWFHPGRIDVIRLEAIDKNAMVPHVDGALRKITPANYGDPIAQFESAKLLFEHAPSIQAYGLDGYRRKNRERGILWAGHRADGEFFFFRSTDTPGEPLPRGVLHPLCDVRYYSNAEDLRIAYRYPQHHIARWKEIDQAIWTKLREWRIK